MEEKLSIEEDVTAEKDSLHNFSFTKAHRLLRKYEYSRMFRHGSRLVGKNICIDYLLSEYLKNPKLGITVSTRYGKSHERNLFKRKVREAFRHLIPILSKNISINIIPRYKAKFAKSTDIQEEIRVLLKSIENDLTSSPP